jgi:hypothetical protein
MTYAIGSIVYGVDLQPPSSYDTGVVDTFKQFRDEIDDLSESEVITSQYSGSGDQPLYFGIDLGEIDECKTVNGADLLQILGSADNRRGEYDALLENLKQHASPALYAAVSAIEPQVFITWGSS